MITRLLEKSIRRTEAVDREALCIVAGEKVSRIATARVDGIDPQVWQLRLTLHFLADEGNLLDCAALAAMTALRHFRKPEVEVIGDEVIVVSRGEASEASDRNVPIDQNSLAFAGRSSTCATGDTPHASLRDLCIL
jgi:exosome complex RNA-binding protein Rrp42 (RNase PH superfamily)